MFSAIGEIYSRILELARRAPIIFLLPVFAELVQHLAEFNLGMFTARDGIEAGFETTVRLAFGAVKVMTIFIVILLAPRLWFYDFDLRRTLRPNWRNIRFFTIVVFANIFLSLFTEGLRNTINLFINTASMPAALELAVKLSPDFFVTIASLFILLWFVAGLIGDFEMTIGRSIRLMSSRILWAIYIFVLSIGPLYALHYALNFGAKGKSISAVAGMLAVDSIVVGVLGAALGAYLYVVYRRSVASSTPQKEADEH